MVRVIRRLLKKVLSGTEYNRRGRWSRLLSGNIKIGKDVMLQGAKLEARQADGCSLTIGDHSIIQGSIILERNNVSVEIGARTFIDGGTILDVAEGMDIGDDVLMAFGILVMDHDSHSQVFDERRNDVMDWRKGKKNWDNVKRSHVSIGDKAWIGAKSIILKGITIGEGAVVGAGSVVTRNVKPYTVVAGNPAKEIKAIPVDER